MNGPDCKSCSGTIYPDDSKSLRINWDSKRLLFNKERGIKVSGYEALEEIAFSDLDDKSAALSMDFILATSFRSRHKFDADGVLGLSKHGSFINQLFDKDVINKKMFATNFQGLKGKLWIGDYPKSAFKSLKTDSEFNKALSWINAEKDSKDWATTLTSITI